MKERSERSRIYLDITVRLFSAFSALFGLVILIWILTVVILRGISAINWEFFTELPTPPGMGGGGLANAILGTVIITVVATFISVPFGLLAGVYLSEFGGQSKFAQNVRFLTNILMGTPSIIIGIFVYTMLVRPFGHFSGYAGSVALAILMFPLVTRTTEDILQLVPNALRESALALGMPRWKVTINVVFRAAKKGLITGIILSVARISGETAPLLFTALNSPYWPTNFTDSTANLTVTIFNYAMSPYEDWQKAAWGASFLITFAVLITTLMVRYLVREKHGK
ncbi:MAG: phosphate ABC transporter permease PstA [Caldisericaceae bacterium]|nr:phosphate ABC transporter permease PstA [Caldisericaceae bacterium]